MFNKIKNNIIKIVLICLCLFVNITITSCFFNDDIIKKYHYDESLDSVYSLDELTAMYNKMQIDHQNANSVNLKFKYDNLQDIVDYINNNSIKFNNNNVYFSELSGVLEIKITYEPYAIKTTERPDVTYIPNYNAYQTVKTRSDDFDDFKINDKTTYPVNNSENLYYVMKEGYNPIISEDDQELKELYNKIKNINRNIINDDMDDYTKCLVIYEYIVENIVYDANLLDVPIEDSYFYDGYYLEGVVNNQKGVCSGMAKLFLCLCALEGIPCEYVVGNSISNNIGHAWNKVMIDGAWYIVDVTNGHAVYGDKYYLSHAYFLLSDDEYLFATPSIEPNTNKDIKCTNTYDVFSKQYIDGLPIAVNNFNEAVDLFSAISKKEYFNNTIMLEIKFNYPITSIEDDVKSILKEIGFYNRFGYSEINDSYLIFLYNNYLYNN